MDQLSQRLAKPQLQVKAICDRNLTPLVYRWGGLKLQQKFTDVHRAYGRRGVARSYVNVESHTSARRLCAVLVQCMASSHHHDAHMPCMSVRGPPARAQVKGESRVVGAFGTSVTPSRDQSPEHRSLVAGSHQFDRATSEPPPTEPPVVSIGESQESLRIPDSQEQNYTSGTPVASDTRCSVVADTVNDVEGSGPVVTLKINIGSVPASPGQGSSTFLTDSKEKEKEKKKRLKELGITPVVKKQQKYVEEHYDDCGENLAGIGGLTSESHFADADSSGSDLDFEEQLYFDNDQLTEQLSLLFLSVPVVSPVDTVRAFRADGLDQFLAACNTKQRCYDIAELCGGEGRTSVLAVRMKLQTGENFDMVTGTDLNSAIDQRNTRMYFEMYTVLVAVMAPMCTPFGPMGQFNEHKYPEGWTRSYNVAAPHGRFCGEIALLQMRKKLHWGREHPHPTTLDREPPWPEVIATPGVTKAIWDRCRTGLSHSTTNRAGRPPNSSAHAQRSLSPSKT